MNAKERRDQILIALEKAKSPISASRLAGKLGVSRQIIVGDVALLRAGGSQIAATARGYMLKSDKEELICTLACLHSKEDIRDELYTIVDQGAKVLDVMIEHPIYGDVSATLELANRYEVDQFMEKSQASDARPLSLLTEGIHFHRIAVTHMEVEERVKKALQEKGYLLSK